MDYEFDGKILFSSFLPYGFTSRMALMLGIDATNVPYMEYSPDMSMEERLRVCKYHDINIRRTLIRFQDAQYIDQVQRKYGKSDYQQIQLLRLTQRGLDFLTALPLDQTNDSMLPKSQESGFRNSHGPILLESDDAQVLRVELSLIGPDAVDLRQRSMRDAIENNTFSLLANAQHLVPHMASILPQMNGYQLYRAWRTVNIDTLFRTNGFLSILDRRPLASEWNLCGMNDPEKEKERTSENTHDITTLSAYAVGEWCQQHPASYSFISPTAIKEPEVWEATPAYYASTEMGIYNGAALNLDYTAKGEKNFIRHTFSGLALGAQCSYIVHHTRTSDTPWYPNVEKRTIDAVEKFIKEAKIKNGIKTENKQIKNAIIVCPTIHQFAAFFRNFHKKKGSTGRRINAPYDSVHLIPLNHSGAKQLRILLLSNPGAYQAAVLKQLLESDNRFSYNEADTVYQLSFEGEAVLVAHTMDLQRLYAAWLDYREGKRFLISCYPQQVKYLKKILPECSFL